MMMIRNKEMAPAVIRCFIELSRHLYDGHLLEALLHQVKTLMEAEHASIMFPHDESSDVTAIWIADQAWTERRKTFDVVNKAQTADNRYHLQNVNGRSCCAAVVKISNSIVATAYCDRGDNIAQYSDENALFFVELLSALSVYFVLISTQEKIERAIRLGRARFAASVAKEVTAAIS